MAATTAAAATKGGKWTRVSQDGAQAEAFGPAENAAIFEAFEALRFHNGPSSVSVGGWRLDFVRQLCTEDATQRAMKLELRWERTAVAPYVPEVPPSAEDAELLYGVGAANPPCVTWLWWCGEWEHFGNETLRRSDPRWMPYSTPGDAAALENAYAKWTAQPGPQTATCVINGHYSATLEKMQQYKTGDPWHARPIARAVFRWFWLDDAGKWQPYSDLASEAIERGMLARETLVTLPVEAVAAPAEAPAAGDKLTNVAKQQPQQPVQYEVNLVEMCQFRKGSKFNRRDVRRAGTVISAAHTNSLRINAEMHSFDEFLPSNWTPMPQGKTHVTVAVDMASEEAQKLVRLMNETIAPEGHGNRFGVVAGPNVDPKSFPVVRIDRLQTLRTYRSYVAAKLRIAQRWHMDVPGLECSKYLKQRPLVVPMIEAASNEYYFFHGCNPLFVQTLVNADKAFDTRGISLQNMYGAGLYFAENSSKSNQYIPCPHCKLGSIGSKKRCTCTQRNTTEPYAILICRVVMGNFYISRNDSEEVARQERSAPEIPDMPGQRYDSVLGECRKYGGKELRLREVVVYDRALMYPEYVIWYHRSEEPWKPTNPGKNA